MKELNLYEIKEMALKSRRAVFSAQQLANLTKKTKSIANVYSARLVKKGLAKRVVRGKISFVDDDFVIATQLIEPSYISLSSALNLHGVIQQVPARVECVTTKNTFSFPFCAYHLIKPNLFFGYKKEGRGGSYIFIAEPEKAVLDGIYLKRISSKTVIDILPNLDIPEIKNILKSYKKEKNNCAIRVVNFFEGLI